MQRADRGAICKGVKLVAFSNLARATVALTIALMGAGAFVRVTGAGMGCPDWPMCFGLLIPPTDAAQLPPQYDPALFNVVKTWTEYLNRLLGVLVGVFAFATLLAAIAQHRRHRDVLWPTVAAFVGVGYAAWLGARVVAHNLAPWSVSVHLLCALTVLGLLLLATANALDRRGVTRGAADRRVHTFARVTLAGALIQAVLGTQVRGTLSDYASDHVDAARTEWLDHVGVVDILHRNLGLLVMFACVALAFVARRSVNASAARFALASAIFAVVQVVVGLGLVYAGLPRALQLFHLESFVLLASCLWMAALTSRERKHSRDV